jgi:hypothetical protein
MVKTTHVNSESRHGSPPSDSRVSAVVSSGEVVEAGTVVDGGGVVSSDVQETVRTLTASPIHHLRIT